MTTAPDSRDAVVIGGGFYGATIAIYLAKQRGFRRVLLVEQEAALMRHASYHNQARVHSGHHYPRSFTTAYRSRVNLPKFVHDWPQAVRSDFIQIYAIARHNSKVTARQFMRFCHDFGGDVRPTNPAQRSLFDPRLIEDAFVVDEYAFDATRLAEWAQRELQAYQIEVRLQTRAAEIRQTDSKLQTVTLVSSQGQASNIATRYIFNCTYSGLNQITGDVATTRAGLKQEITEMALLRPPSELAQLGITVMDGPFFSFMPFPARPGLHTLSHVRYTPHYAWADGTGHDPYAELAAYDRATRVDRMLRDATRYVPALRDAQYVESLFEVKTVLAKNEGDDGRPILFEKDPALPGCYAVLGGKIDNIFDILERLEHETFQLEPTVALTGT